MSKAQAAKDRWRIEQAKRGNNAAFDSLWREHGPFVENYITRRFRLQIDKPDIYQETAFRVWRYLHKFSYRSAFRSWACAVGVNCAKMHFRKAGKILVREPSYEPEALEKLADDQTWIDDRTEDRLIARVGLQAIHLRVVKLDPHSRHIWHAREVEGLSNRSVAAALRLSGPAVKSRLHRARLQIFHRWAA